MDINSKFSAQLGTFQQLHFGDSPLVLVNVWDAASAMIVQASGGKALATSSASLAWSLGYADGGALPVDELLQAIARIVRVSRVPVTVDIEAGFSDDPVEVVSLVSALVGLGVVGINLEDGNQAPELLVAKIKAIRASDAGTHLFINARTDVYLRGLAKQVDAINMVESRLVSYQAAGADGGFIPGVGDVNLAIQLRHRLNMPLNFMLTSAELARAEHVDTLFKSGVSRLTVGPASFLDAYSTLIRAVKPSQVADTSAQALELLNYNEMNIMADGIV